MSLNPGNSFSTKTDVRLHISLFSSPVTWENRALGCPFFIARFSCPKVEVTGLSFSCLGLVSTLIITDEAF